MLYLFIIDFQHLEGVVLYEYIEIYLYLEIGIRYDTEIFFYLEAGVMYDIEIFLYLEVVVLYAYMNSPGSI
jgi:hypothetical protein